MNKVIENWDPNKKYTEGTVIKFDSKLYLAQLDNQGILPIHRIMYINALNSYSNTELVDRLLQEYQCTEDLPIVEVPEVTPIRLVKMPEGVFELVCLDNDPMTFSIYRGLTGSYYWKEL